MDHGLRANSAAVTPSLFQADELAPYDYDENCQRKDRYGPEERLLFAILEDAVSCYQVHLLGRKQEEQILFAEAESWIFDDSVEFVSFNNICDLLSINATYLRRGLLAWKEWQLARSRPPSSKTRWRTFAHGQRAFGIAATENGRR
jgi:hypothetical protein